MRITTIFARTAVCILSFACIPFDNPDSASEEDLQSVRNGMPDDYFGDVSLAMVSPYAPEGFTILNLNRKDKDLRDYVVTDGEGTVTFSEPFILRSGGAVTIMSEPPEPWMEIDSYFLYGQNGITAKKFSLADAGDDVHLMKDGEILDSFVWGTKYDGGGPGQGMEKLPKKTVAMKYKYRGTGTRWDGWYIYAPGMTMTTSREVSTSDALVTPFSFPESDGSEIIHALQQAERRVDISIYTLSHPRIQSVLAHLLDRGVQVRILAEGSPAGGIGSDEIGVLTSLARKGADIHLIKSSDGYKRYAFVHSKYAIIDSSRTIITSENWTAGSFANNRGWGCIIESEGFVRDLEDIFRYDFDIARQDIFSLGDLYPTAVPSRIVPFVPAECDAPSYSARVYPVIGPDYSREILMDYISGAESRLYSQQLDVEYGWLTGDGDPLSAMEDLALRGVDCRLLVDVSFDDPLDSNVRDGYGIFSYYDDNRLLEVRYDDSPLFSTAHNKGIIRDDSVWVGSMNWTDNSIDFNREISAIIYSADVADYFCGLFLEDWGIEFEGEVSLSVKVTEGGYGADTLMDATRSIVPPGSTFEWDLDGDGDFERTGKSVSWRFYRPSECLLRVTVPDGSTYEQSFEVTLETGEEEQGGFLEGPVKYLPLAALCAIIIAVNRFRRYR